MHKNFKRIVSFARKRSNNPQQEAKVLQELLPKFSVIVPEDGGLVEKLADLCRIRVCQYISELLDIDEVKNKKVQGVFESEQHSVHLVHEHAQDSKVTPQSLIFNKYILEVGFGSGENILDRAINNPKNAYIGCEVFTGGVVKLLKDIEDNQVKNIRIWHADAVELIMRLPLNSLNLVYILHPDPWPKQRHKKRRLINPEFLKLIASRMIPNGDLLIITDHEDYAKHINTVIKAVEDIFMRKTEDYPAITKTKYRLKAEANGIIPEYFYLVKK